MEAYVFRHGETLYTQEIVPLENADDLTHEGARTIINSANHLGQRLDEGVPVEIHSSPFGRSLHTAKKIRNVFAGYGLNVSEIIEDPLLREVDNFEWDLFHPLVVGGEIEYNGEQFIIYNDLTNPGKLEGTMYFRSDSAQNLSEEAQRTLPKEYLEKLDSFERYPSVIGRLDSKLDSLNGSEAVTIISTHEGLTGRFAEEIAGRKDAYLDRGKYFGLTNKNGVWIPIDSQEGAIVYGNR